MAIAETAVSTSPAAEQTARPARLQESRVRAVLLALIVPGLLLVLWHVATTLRWTRLIPTPWETAAYMVDFVVGGIHDDAFSATAHVHLLASMQRV